MYPLPSLFLQSDTYRERLLCKNILIYYLVFPMILTLLYPQNVNTIYIQFFYVLDDFIEESAIDYFPFTVNSIIWVE